MSRNLLQGLGLALLACVSLGLATPVFAEPGVTIGLGRVTLNEPLRAGTEQMLPSVPVRNSGTSAARYRVVMTKSDNQEAAMPDPSWFLLWPQEFDLQPGEQRDVSVALHLPWVLAPGPYAGLIQVGPLPDPGAGGTGLAVAAAARVAFSVEHGNILSATVFNLTDALQHRAPWSYMLLLAAVVVTGYPLIGHFFGIQIAVERRGR